VARRAGAALALVSLALVLVATVAPVDGPDSGMVRWCPVCGELGLSDVIANVLLFLPLGAGLFWSGASAGRSVAAAVLLSAGIEFVQLRVMPGRDAALGDLLANTAGAVLGVALAWWLPVRRRSLARALAAAAAVQVVFAALGLLHRPYFPPTVYYGQWTADLGQYEHYRGRVLSAEIGGVPLPSWRLGESAAVARLLAQGAPVRVHGLAGPATARFAPLFGIVDAAHREIVVVGPDRGDLVLHASTRAVDVRLRQPALRWRGAMSGIAPGDTLAVEVRRRASGYCLALNGREICGLALTAGQVWEFVQSVPHLPRAAGVALDCLAMALLGLLVGLVAPRGRAGYAPLVLTLLGAGTVPLLAGLAPTPLVQLAALALGFGAGARVP